jgi:CRP/FNR family transcriptional regulator, nitrogen fixation regulation protein
LAFEAISRSQARMLILGSRSALQKVGSFLVEMAERSPHGATEVIVLPMSRYDIADYLALSVETVSRALTDLKQRGMIALSGTHEVTIVDRGALDKVNGDAA